jgi:hypothetical protein
MVNIFYSHIFLSFQKFQFYLFIIDLLLLSFNFNILLFGKLYRLVALVSLVGCL